MTKPFQTLPDKMSPEETELCSLLLKGVKRGSVQN